MQTRLNSVLIIEDEWGMRVSLRKMLELEKFQVTEAGNLQEAEKILNYSSFDVFLLDLNLPDGNGVDFLKK